MKYRFIDHTADVAFEVFGKDVAELIENASYAFYDAFVDVSRIDSSVEKVLEVEAESVDSLLYRWLNELLFLFDTEFFAAKHVEVSINQTKCTGRLVGGRFTPELVKVEPKAITLHKFKVEKVDEGYRAFVVVDI